MTVKKQVNADHYGFRRYLTIKRWTSIWHQINQILELKPQSVLELGPGPGTFKSVALHLGLHVETFDIDPELGSDHVGDARSMAFEDNAFDIVCAFQMLEHLEYPIALEVLSEMSRVSKEHLVISLPDAHTLWKYSFYLPFLGQRTLLLPRPSLTRKLHKFDGEHHWEINKRGYDLGKVIHDFSAAANVKLMRTFRAEENTYHRFFIFKKSQ